MNDAIEETSTRQIMKIQSLTLQSKAFAFIAFFALIMLLCTYASMVYNDITSTFLDRNKIEITHRNGLPVICFQLLDLNQNETYFIYTSSEKNGQMIGAYNGEPNGCMMALSNESAWLVVTYNNQEYYRMKLKY